MIVVMWLLLGGLLVLVCVGFVMILIEVLLVGLLLLMSVDLGVSWVLVG